uniref:Programmed cell death protein 4 n=1 Tax=Strongyloides papillosus TaxID=174720 RepID=A0A0N5BEK6_STREA
MSFFASSDEVNETHNSDLDKENNLPPRSQCFRRRTEDVNYDSFDDSPDNGIDDLSKLTQHANKKVLHTQSMVNKNDRNGSQLHGSTKKIPLPKELEDLFKNVGLEIVETDEYSACVSVVDGSVEYKNFISGLESHLKSLDADRIMPVLLSIITLENESKSFGILEVLSRPIRINENFFSSFLQILISMKVLQTRILQEIFKFFGRSTSEDTMVKTACDIYLDLLKDTGEIYEQEKICTIISSLKYDTFDIVYRNELAGFVYGFIQDFKLENELYRELMKWIKRSDLDDCENFRLALLESVKNVAADPVNIKSECFALIMNINIFECDSAIEVINYTSMALTSDNKNQIVLFLLALGQNLRFDKFKESPGFDKIICNMFCKIMMLITNYGANGINIVLSVLNGSGNNKTITSADFGVTSDVTEEELMDMDVNDEDGNDVDEEDKGEETVLKRRFSEFDYILSFATIFEYLNPPTNKVKDIAKLMVANIKNHRESLDEDREFISTLLKCGDFPIKYLEALMYVGEYFLKENNPDVNEMGKHIFLEMFSNLDYNREEIIALLVDNILSKDDVSYNALRTIHMIVKKCPYEFSSHIDYYLKRTSDQCTKFEPRLLRVFFKILSSLSISCSEEQVGTQISSLYEKFDQYLKSTDNNSFRVALSANIVRICELIRKDPEKYSSEISALLEKLDCCSSYLPEFRAYYFSEFSVNLKGGYKTFSKQSKELVEYMNKNVLNYVKDTYFMCLEKPPSYASSESDDFCPLFEGYNSLDARYWVKHTTFLKRDLSLGIWNVEMLNPLIPMIQFMYQVLRLLNKWKQQDDKASLENLYFIFEANIDLRGIGSMIKKENLNDREISDLRFGILFLLDYIGNLLNTFADCRCSPKHNEILQKKYRLYVKLEDVFYNIVNTNYKTCFKLPNLLSNGYSVSKNSLMLFGLKKSNLPVKVKKDLKTEVDHDKNIVDNEDNNMGNGNIGTLQVFGNTQTPNGKKDSKKSYFKILPFTKISEHTTPFTVSVLVKCVDAFLESPLLLNTVFNGLNVAISRIESSFVTKKTTNFGFLKNSKCPEIFFPYIDKQSKKDLRELLSNCVTPMMTVFNYCKEDVTDESENSPYQSFAEQSLKIILRSMKFSTNNNDRSGKAKIEDMIFQFISEKSASSVCDNDVAVTIFNYFLESRNCLITSSTMAVSVIEMLLDFIGENELLRLKLAKKCLDLLDYPWPEKNSANSSTVPYCKDTAKILEIYFNLLPPKYQILAAVYMVTKKLVYLAPIKDQKELMEMSFTYSFNYGKIAVSDPEELRPFNATTPKTLSYLYSVCFATLNGATQKYLAKNETLQNQSLEKQLNNWYFSVTCFSKLTDFICVQKFRTKSILSTVVKEGKKFLDFITSNKSSFMEHANNQEIFNQQKERFEQIFDGIERAHYNISSYNNEFQKKLTGATLKLFPQFTCGFTSFKRLFNNILKISAASASLSEKARKRSSNVEKNVEPKQKKRKSSKKAAPLEEIENMEM